jgi:hypothetical protein
VTAGTCQYCQCSEDKSCPAPCRWRDDTRTVCSACDDGEKIAQLVIHVFAKARSVRQALRQADKAGGWEAMSEDARRALVMGCRAAAVGFLDGALADVLGDTLDDLQELMAFLDERFRGEMREDESPTSMAIRLLSEGRTTRIIVP